MKYCVIGTAAALFMLSATSCEQSSTIGSTLLGDQVEIVVDSTFTVTGQSVAINDVKPRTVEQLLGDITIPNFGRIRSGAVSQLLPATEFDTEDFSWENVDSAFIRLQYADKAFVGDSVVPMGLTIYPLTNQLPADINSSFNPTDYFNPSDRLGQLTYNTSTFGDSTMGAKTRAMNVKLPHEFGQYLFREFQKHPSYFANGQTFADNVFKGFYLKNTYGSGRLLRISRTTLTMNLRKISYNEETKKQDTLDAVHEYLFVSPQVINNNIISLELDPKISTEIENGAAMLVAPAGYRVNMRFPAPEIISTYKAGANQLSTLNTVTMFLPADTLETGMGITPPPYVLLLPANKAEEFFANFSLPDETESFYASYNSSNGGYYFSGLDAFIRKLMDKDEITEDDYTLAMIPVQVNFEQDMTSYYSTTQIVSQVLPYISTPSAATIHLDKAKIILTYSKQTVLK